MSATLKSLLSLCEPQGRLEAVQRPLRLPGGWTAACDGKGAVFVQCDVGAEPANDRSERDLKGLLDYPESGDFLAASLARLRQFIGEPEQSTWDPCCFCDGRKKVGKRSCDECDGKGVEEVPPEPRRISILRVDFDANLIGRFLAVVEPPSDTIELRMTSNKRGARQMLRIHGDGFVLCAMSLSPDPYKNNVEVPAIEEWLASRGSAV